MTTATTPAQRIPLSFWIIGAMAVIVIAATAIYFSRPLQTAPPQTGDAPAAAKAYLPNLQLSDVSMQASENFMKQQIVEVQGKITNKGPRKLAAVQVYCLFYGSDGQEIHRERLPIVHSLAPAETRAFRLPFDTLPDGWNQAMPRLVIADISFAT